MNKDLERVKLRLLISLTELNCSERESSLFSFKYPHDEDLKIAHITAMVKYLDEQFRDPKKILEKALKDKNYKIKETVIELISSLHYDSFIKDLVPLLEDNNSSIADMASEVIKTLASEEKTYLKPLIDFILKEDKTTEVRIRGIKALRYENDSTLILDTLINLITSENIEIRKEAIEAIKYLIDHDLVINSLLEKLYSDIKEEIELSVLWALANIRSPKTIEYIKPYLDHENLLFQEAAIYGIGKSGDQNMISTLLEKLDSLEAK